MLGAIIGDISGSRFEWENLKSKKFELLTYASVFRSISLFFVRVFAGSICFYKTGPVTVQGAEQIHQAEYSRVSLLLLTAICISGTENYGYRKSSVQKEMHAAFLLCKV